MEIQVPDPLWENKETEEVVQMREYGDLVYVRPVNPDDYQKIRRYAPENFAEEYRIVFKQGETLQ
jgi:hypothetical protein